MSDHRTFVQSTGSVSDNTPLGESGRAVLANTGQPETGAIIHRHVPLNSEPNPPRLASGFITPQDDFYIRNHGTIPALQELGYTIQFETPGAAPRDVPLAELKSNYSPRSVTAVMQCAGNRRSDMGLYKPVSGDAWRVGAIGNAAWGGVALGDVLRGLGVSPSNNLHVAFAAHDDIEEDGEQFKYGVSIPLAKAMAAETMIAFEMNGQALSKEHGFPARIVVPGYAGARSPKWLASIKVQDRPSENHIQQKVYKLFPPDVTRQTADFTKGVFINDMPLNSAMLLPLDGAEVPHGKTRVQGWAIATRERVARVEVSADNGMSWTPATLDTHADEPWSWTLWNATVDLVKGRHTLAVRAFDSGNGSQPATPAPIWNFAGYLSRAWHRVEVSAV